MFPVQRRVQGCVLVFLAAWSAAAAAPLRVSAPEQTVLSDPNPAARIAAADALGRRPGPRALEALRGALGSEKDPRVVDAVVAALWKLEAPVTDPQACGELAGRSWEAVVASRLFECWRAAASPDDVFQAAISAPDVRRALALVAISKRTDYLAVKQNPAQRARLLDSSIDGLSRYANLAPSTVDALHEALWDLSGANMAAAIDASDRIGPLGARLAASTYLARRFPADYLACRRPKQSMIGFLAAAAFALLLLNRRLRRVAVPLVLSAFGWALWTWLARDARQLPPLSLSFRTTSVLAFFAAGIATLLSGLLPWEKLVQGALRGFGRVGLCGALAGMMAAGLTIWTRRAGYFPVLDEGWDLLVEPFGALNLGIFLGVLFALIDGWMFLRRKRSDPEPDPLADL